jgi:membrane protein
MTKKKITFFQRTKHVVKDTIQRFSAADPIVYSAAIAFFTLFSMPSILYIIVRVAGAIFSSESIKNELYRQVNEKVGKGSAEQIDMILSEGDRLGSDPLTNILSILLLLFTATVVFNFIKKALNSIWSVKPKPKKGWLKFLVDRLLSFSLIVLMGILIIASVLADSVIALFEDEFSNQLLGLTPFIVKGANFLVSFLLLTAVFSVLFKIMPDIKSTWKPVVVGGIITAALFTLGKYAISSIITNTNISSTYGAAGSLAALLLWVFYSSVIILLGAIFTKIYYLHLGFKVKPSENAIALEIKEIEKERGG